MADWTITPEELKKIQNEVFLLDVREPEENSAGAIENSKLIPLGEVADRGPAELDPQKDIVIYCAHGMRSLEALMILKQKGFEKVRSLEGGFVAWQEQN